MIYRLKYIAFSLCAITLFTTMSSYAQSEVGQEVDIKIYFPYDESYIDTTYMGNDIILRRVDSLLRDVMFISTLSRIEVTAQSSPEGRIEYNKRLSERRKESLERYFTEKYPQITTSLWSFNAIAENWDLFHQHLLEDSQIPNREQVLKISESDRNADDKEWLLKNLNSGKSWSYIKENILPAQRFGASILFIPTVPIATPIAIKKEIDLQMLEIPRCANLETAEQSDKNPKMIVALKSNLILDLLTAVNIAAELPIGERWSIVGEVVYPWWRSWKGDFTMQIESYHGEVKYWLGDRSKREQLQGWSVGAYGGWSRYDIQPLSHTGVQGDMFDIGAEIGFSHHIARNLHLEYTLGLGYISTDYEDYKMVNSTDEYGDIKVIPYPWMQNSLKTILPTRCGVSLVWTIKKDGGKR